MKNLSVIIITNNSQDKIERCLKSVADLSDDIVVLDSNSVDGTFEICKKYTPNVFRQEWKGYAQQKNIALSKTKHEWVLWIDSDEELTIEAQNLLRSVLKNPGFYCGFKLKRRTQFMGRWMDHCWGNDYVLRVFKKDEDVYFPEKAVHEYLNIEGEILNLETAVINHYPYRDLNEYFSKFMNYAELDAKEKFEKGERTGIFRLIFAFPITFFKLYFLKLGFMDGLQGFILCVLSALHNFAKYVRLWELKIRQD